MQGTSLPSSLSRRDEAAELGVFLLLILPSLALSFVNTGGGGVSFPLVAGATILRDLGLLGLILLLVSRDRQPYTTIGWVNRRVGREVWVGLLLSIPVLVGAQLVQIALQRAGLSGPAPSSGTGMPAGPGEILLAFVLVVVVAVAEETIFRGYLILRFGSLLRSRAWAVVLSSVIFAIGHGYEGGAAVVTIGLTGLAFALVYVWRQSLVAPIVMHFVFDFVAIVLAPLLAP
jgi:uncharacterized protein